MLAQPFPVQHCDKSDLGCRQAPWWLSCRVSCTAWSSIGERLFAAFPNHTGRQPAPPPPLPPPSPLQQSHNHYSNPTHSAQRAWFQSVLYPAQPMSRPRTPDRIEQAAAEAVGGPPLRQPNVDPGGDGRGWVLWRGAPRQIPGYPRIDQDNSTLAFRFDGGILDSKPWGEGLQVPVSECTARPSACTPSFTPARPPVGAHVHSCLRLLPIELHLIRYRCAALLSLECCGTSSSAGDCSVSRCFAALGRWP